MTGSKYSEQIVGKPTSNGITVLTLYVIENGVSPVDTRGVVL